MNKIESKFRQAPAIDWRDLASVIPSIARDDGWITNSDSPWAVPGAPGCGVTGIEYDSRKVGLRSAFVAMRGGTTDGNIYIDETLRRGALGIISDSSEAFDRLSAAYPDVPRLLVVHGRTALAQASAAFFGHPERHLRSTGVTGTNGKTTTAFLIEALLHQASRSTILVGTIEYHVAGQVRPSAHTTPESRDLFELMADGVDRGATELVMEVSSHALDQGRVTGVGFDVAVFTNLTRDHLDYHGTMESYFAAKQLLFSGTKYPRPRASVLNANDPHGRDLARIATQAGSEVITYAIDTKSDRMEADWRAEHLRLSPAGAHFELISPHGTAEVRSSLAGEVNIANLIAALAAAHARGIPWEDLVAAIPALHPVPGRFQPVDAGQPFTVIVDYAHTDDALRNLTALARQLITANGASNNQGRVITLFGCGGDRDRTKRPKMGQAAGEGSDFVVVTSDNPRSEDPSAIIEEILPGVDATEIPVIVEPDRVKGIAYALAQAHPGDVVLLAGKGHEKVQILRDGPIFFDDVQVALSALRALGYGGVQ
jgi:UDP-N-acetylmuramoyl-L-alanyl-D-glutamate--2,6-diaminopimelate ligase